MKIHSAFLALLAATAPTAASAERPTPGDAWITQLEVLPQLPEQAGFLLQTLAGTRDHQVQLMLLALAPGAEVAPTRGLKGSLVVSLLEGSAQVSGAAGSKEKALVEDDAAVLFPGGAGLRNAGDATMQALVVSAPGGGVTLERVEPARKATKGLKGSKGSAARAFSGKPPAIFRGGVAKPIALAEGRAEVVMQVEGEGVPAYLGKFRALPGLVIPAHLHESSTEVLFVLSGSGELLLDGRTSELGEGSVVLLPAGVKHGFRHTGEAPLEAVQIYAPPGPEARFRSASGADADAGTRSLDAGR